MKQVLFAITNLEIGGAERVLVRLVPKLNKNSKVSILTLYGQGALLPELDKKITVHSIYPKKREDYSKLKRLWISVKLKLPLWKKHIIKKYELNQNEVLVSFLEGPMTELLSYAKPKKKIAWIHTDFTKHYPKKKYKNLKKSYDTYDKLIFVSRDSYEKFDEIDPDKALANKKQIIYNYVDQDLIIKESKKKMDLTFSKEVNFVVVARLVEAKGIDRLMKTHKRLLEENLSHHIYVVGDGPLKESLLSLQKSLQIEETFHFLGEQKNPYPYMMKADYLLLPSHYEGYPVTLIEGMILNKYIGVTNISSIEVLKDYPNYLVMENNEEGLFNGIKELIKEKRTCKSYQETRNSSILKQIEELLRQL